MKHIILLVTPNSPYNMLSPHKCTMQLKSESPVNKEMCGVCTYHVPLVFKMEPHAPLQKLT